MQDADEAVAELAQRGAVADAAAAAQGWDYEGWQEMRAAGKAPAA